MGEAHYSPGPKSIAKRIREAAETLSATPEEYILDLPARDMDPVERAGEYIWAILELTGRWGVRASGETLNHDRCKWTRKVRVAPEVILNHSKERDGHR